MKLLITTQVRENYAAHDWDGQGKCPQGWKNKGGSDYVILDVPLEVDQLKAMVEQARPQIESNDDYFQEWIIDWEVVEDSHKTDFEKYQEEYDPASYVCRPRVIDLNNAEAA